MDGFHCFLSGWGWWCHGGFGINALWTVGEIFLFFFRCISTVDIVGIVGIVGIVRIYEFKPSRVLWVLWVSYPCKCPFKEAWVLRQKEAWVISNPARPELTSSVLPCSIVLTLVELSPTVLVGFSTCLQAAVQPYSRTQFW